MSIIHKMSLLAIILFFSTASSGNIFFPDGIDTDNEQMLNLSRGSAAVFLEGVARAYDMMSKVELRDFKGASKQAEASINHFKNAWTDCNKLQSYIASDTKAIAHLQNRRYALGEKFRASYSKAGAIPIDSNDRWNEVINLARNGQIGEIVGLCTNSADKMIKMINVYNSWLSVDKEPPLVENWKIANQIEIELQTLRYAAIIVEGPLEGPPKD